MSLGVDPEETASIKITIMRVGKYEVPEFYHVGAGGWKIDDKFLIIGKGIPRILIPLSTVSSITLEHTL